MGDARKNEKVSVHQVLELVVSGQQPFPGLNAFGIAQAIHGLVGNHSSARRKRAKSGN